MKFEMEHFQKRIVAAFAGLFLLLASAVGHPMDSVEVSLLTCSPGTEVWAHYGHTAVRWHDRTPGGQDLVFNYGMFSTAVPHFEIRFILGLTDYRLGEETFEEFRAQYAYEGRGVVEQVLDITPADKEAIAAALRDNLRPENIVYRYNFFYDNCTTRARDLLVGSLYGRVSYPPARQEKSSFRAMIHEWNNGYPWAQAGEDALLGIAADRATSKAQQQFLPDHLRADFAAARYDGRPLVRETRRVLVPQMAAEANPAPPLSNLLLSPLACALALAVVASGVLAWEWRRGGKCWAWDLALMMVAGIVGLLLAVMVFSQHPCVRVNLLLLIFNPLPLIFAWRAVCRIRQGRPDGFWRVWGVLIVLGLVGGFFQHYPPAIVVVALILLCNCVAHQLPRLGGGGRKTTSGK